MTDATPISQRLKQQQTRLLLITSVTVACVLTLSLLIFYHHSARHTNTEPSELIHFDDLQQSPDLYQATLEHLQSAEAEHTETTDALQTKLKDLQAQMAQRSDKASVSPELYRQLETFKGQLHTLTQQVEAQNEVKNNPLSDFQAHNETLTSSESYSLGLATTGDIHVPLTSTQSNNPKTLDTYVPAGTHVLGVLLQGAELVADTAHRHHPKPILIRLIREGTLPNGQHGHLQGCLITAAMTSDISSGRGDVRLERLSCVNPDQSIVDIPIYGTVATHAKEGIPGHLYTRERQRLLHRFEAGILSGLSAVGLHRKNAPTPTLPNEADNTHTSNTLWHQLIGHSAEQSLSQLGSDTLQKTQAIHPVVQVHGGQWVTVVFLKGFFLTSERGVRHDKSEENNEND